MLTKIGQGPNSSESSQLGRMRAIHARSEALLIGQNWADFDRIRSKLAAYRPRLGRSRQPMCERHPADLTQIRADIVRSRANVAPHPIPTEPAKRSLRIGQIRQGLDTGRFGVEQICPDVDRI